MAGHSLARAMWSAMVAMAIGQDASLAQDIANTVIVAPSMQPITPVDAGPRPRRLWISGHSLTERPLPEQMAAIAAGFGHPLEWDRQSLGGSSIRERTVGQPEQEPWSGYRTGVDAQDRTVDVLSALREASRQGRPFETLLITEQHAVLGTLVWNDTVRHLRHYHDRFIEANPAGRSYFYHPWLSLNDKNDPRLWILYERAAAPIWDCIVSRINTSLAAEGRADRISSVPAASALAHLIDKATAEPGLPGLTGGWVEGGTRATVDRLLADVVHYTPLGSYYLALVTYAGISGRSVEGAWKPAEVSAELASTLQAVASNFVAAYRASRTSSTPARCREAALAFNPAYWSYVHETYLRWEDGALRSQLRRYANQWRWFWRFSRDTTANPFFFDAATDKTFWLPPP